MSCTACDMGLAVPGTSGGGRKKKYKKSQRGGAHLGLSPASLTGDSFDRNGPALSRDAHNLYVKQNYELASIKNINAMAGGRKKKRTAKKYRSKSKSKKQRGGILELGAFINEAAVPFTLLAAQQRYRRGTKGYKGRKSRKFRGSRRRR